LSPERTSTRRTQAERSAATREALLDATIECLIEEGYSRTTTARVAERAGVSRGAHLHHFQTRSALVAAAVDRLARRRTEDLLSAADMRSASSESLSDGLDILWSAYSSPLFQAALDLWSDARTDPELRSHLTGVERDMDVGMGEVAERIFPELAGHPRFDRLIELTTATMRGLALLDTMHPGGGRMRKQWPSCRALLVPLFADAAAEHSAVA